MFYAKLFITSLFAFDYMILRLLSYIPLIRCHGLVCKDDHKWFHSKPHGEKDSKIAVKPRFSRIVLTGDSDTIVHPRQSCNWQMNGIFKLVGDNGFTL